MKFKLPEFLTGKLLSSSKIKTNYADFARNKDVLSNIRANIFFIDNVLKLL
jgi:hypothetical protein